LSYVAGNPLTQQRDLLTGRGAVRLEGAGVIRVTGADRLKFLNNNLSQELMNLASGSSAEALLLDPQGHIEQVLHIIGDSDSVWLITARDQGETVAKYLDKMTFRADVSIADVSADFAVFAGFGKVFAGVARFAGVQQIWSDPWPGVVDGGIRYAVKPGAAVWEYREALVPIAEVEQVAGAFEAAGDSALEALRVAARRPDQATEVDAKALPHEFDWLATAVHLKKGCYRGQETVAKVHNLGHPPRRLVFLHLDGSEVELPEHGASVYVAGAEDARGVVTSVGQHYEAGPIALALVSRSVPEDAALEVAAPQANSGRLAATQEVIVPATAGKAADRTPLRKGLLS
jgi:folate-binding protein YgfZ